MRFCTFEIALMCLMGLALLHVSQAQNTPQDYLRAHNAARAQVGVGPMIWDNNVAAYAQNYANRMRGTCRLVHSGGRYGENLAWSSGDMSAKGATDMWVGEKADYHYNSNSCNPGKVCGHYTQIVWRNSVRLGCARVNCNTGGTYIICSYDPPGNWNGERPFSGITI